LLPKKLACKPLGSWADVHLQKGRKVQFLRPLTLDLGGIAKGFAVDAAIQVLRRHGVKRALVNAGGDLRAFGPQPSLVQLRNPSAPRTVTDTIMLSNCALATSAPYFTEKDFRGSRVSHLVNTQTRTALTGAISVSVRARDCWLADALTKVVLNAPYHAEALLAKYRAEAFVFTA
jgi:FAD:protein FMN transferase